MKCLQNKIKSFSEDITIEVLTEDTALKKGLLAEHGLCLLISAGKKSIVFDTGQSDILIHNARALKRAHALAQVSSIILSHGHYDHTGGLPKLVEFLHQKPDVFLCPQSFIPKYSTQTGALRKNPDRYIGFPEDFIPSTHSQEPHSKPPCNFILTTKPFITNDGFIVTGPIPRNPGMDEHLTGFTMNGGEKPRKDRIEDSQALIIPTPEGNIIVTGCAHSGLENIIQYSMEITGESRIRALIGGFHLLNSTDEHIAKMITWLKKREPHLLAPCHCTGKRAQIDLLRAFPGKVSLISTGDRLTVSVQNMTHRKSFTGEKEDSVKENKRHPVLVIFHGSRNPQAMKDAQRVVEELSAIEKYRHVKIGFISFGSPSMKDALKELAQEKPDRVTIIPALIFNGIHIEKDIAQAVEPLARVIGYENILVSHPLGEGPKLSELLSQRLQETEKDHPRQ